MIERGEGMNSGGMEGERRLRGEMDWQGKTRRVERTEWVENIDKGGLEGDSELTREDWKGKEV